MEIKQDQALKAFCEKHNIQGDIELAYDLAQERFPNSKIDIYLSEPYTDESSARIVFDISVDNTPNEVMELSRKFNEDLRNHVDCQCICTTFRFL